MQCPNCGTEGNGAYCAECGAPLNGAKCKSCGAALPPGAKYCTSCGAAARDRMPAPAGSASSAPWIVVGAALLLLIVVLLWPTIASRGDDDAGKVALGPAQIGADPSTASSDASDAPPPLSGTPREQADRLFNRIMTERENGDTAQAKFFLPMGIQAYQMAGDLDADGLYHLSLLQTYSGAYSDALATAQKILEKQPKHLLGLSAAANAARGAGDRSAARTYAQRFLAAFDSESKLQKEEYVDHARMLPELKVEAQAIVK